MEEDRGEYPIPMNMNPTDDTETSGSSSKQDDWSRADLIPLLSGLLVIGVVLLKGISYWRLSIVTEPVTGVSP